MTNTTRSAGEAVPVTNYEKLKRLCWEVADAIDEQGGLGRFEYVTIRGSKAAGRAAVLMGFDVEMPEEISDPLLDAIQDYRKGFAALGAIPAGQITSENEDQIIHETYGKYEAVLDAWDQPAPTREGAIAALNLMGERQMFDDVMGEPLRKAVLGYLEGLAR